MIRSYNDHIHPILALVAALLIFVTGMIIVESAYIYLYIGLIILTYIIFGHGPYLLRHTPILIAISGLMFVLNLIFGRDLTRAYVVFLRALIFGLTVSLGISIRPSRLFRALVNKKVPKQIALGILISQQFVTKMLRELKIISNARKLRGKNQNLNFFENLYRAYLIPIVFRVFSISDNLASSVEIRGFSLKKRSRYADIPGPGAKDIGFILAIILICAGGIYTWTL